MSILIGEVQDFGLRPTGAALAYRAASASAPWQSCLPA